MSNNTQQLNAFGQPIPETKFHIQAQRCFHDGDPCDGEIPHSKYYTSSSKALEAYEQLVVDYPNYKIRAQEITYWPNNHIHKSLDLNELRKQVKVDDFLEEAA